MSGTPTGNFCTNSGIIDADMPALGRVIRAQHAEQRARRLAALPPLPERVAEAMREIAAARGSCDRDDLELRFPDEALTDAVIAAARRLAGRRSSHRVG